MNLQALNSQFILLSWLCRESLVRNKQSEIPALRTISSVDNGLLYLVICTLFIECCLLFSCLAMSNSLWPYGLQHARLPCPSLSPRVCSNWRALNQWGHPTNCKAKWISHTDSPPFWGPFLFRSPQCIKWSSFLLGDDAGFCMRLMNHPVLYSHKARRSEFMVWLEYIVLFRI